jgi:hypothetical protein
MNDAGIVRDDVKEILRMLQRADDRVVRPRENADDSSFRPGTSTAGAAILFVAGDPGDDAVSVHRRSGVLGGDEEILLAWFVFASQERIAGLVDMKEAGDKIGFRRQDVTVLADARDFPGLLEFSEGFVQVHPHAALSAEKLGEFGFIEWAILGRAQDAQDLSFQVFGIHNGDGDKVVACGWQKPNAARGTVAVPLPDSIE